MDQFSSWREVDHELLAQLALRDEASQSFVPRSFTRNFAAALLNSPLIGNRHKRLPFTEDLGRRILEGLNREYDKLKQEYTALLASGSLDTEQGEGDAQQQALLASCCSLTDLKTDLKEAMLSATEAELPRLVTKAYSDNSWVYVVLNKAMRLADESKVGLGGFAHVLHDTIAECRAPFSRWSHKCWRWVNMSPDVLAQYQFSEVMMNLLSFAGFTSACKDKAWTVQNKFTFAPSDGQRQVLLVIHSNDFGVDISREAYIPEEGEVLFTLGQAFQLLDEPREWTAAQLQAELDAPDASLFDERTPVVLLKAVPYAEARVGFFRNLYADGGRPADAVPVLRELLEVSSRGRAPPSEVVELHLQLGIALFRADEFHEAVGELELGIELCRALGIPPDGEAMELLYVAKERRFGGNIHSSREGLQSEALRLRQVPGEEWRAAPLLRGLGDQLLRQGQHDEAAQHFVEAKAVACGAPNEHFKRMTTAGVALSLSKVEQARCRHEQARVSAEEALQLYRDIFGAWHPAIGQALLSVAAAERALGRQDAARAHEEEAVQYLRG